ncbi:MAG TPA: hypothetical protein VGG32_11440 [Thermoplasmata archaeon]|jgi:hypothetical protein
MPSRSSGSSTVGGEGSTDDGIAGDTLEDRVAIEKARALREPGPSWRTWLFQSALRGYYLLGMFIVDVQIVVAWYEVSSVVGLVASLAVAIYLEFLLYRYLWYRPRYDARPIRPFRRTWLRPTEYGRWTPEADLVRAGVSIYRTEEGPNAKEFL